MPARLLLAVALAASSQAFGYPDASPWGAANPSAEEACSSCHYDYDPVSESKALGIDGLPAEAVPGETYPVVVRMTGVDATVSGFQLVASAGTFNSDDAALEADGNAIRSTSAAVNRGSVEWAFSWEPPGVPGGAVEMYLAVSAANDDQSPFGDTIHYRRFVIAVTDAAD
ncbi:MAG: choice-of-anchor V domain-containing protein [Woeseiaceae bacterium]|nr:choice-of-anchor V domain-containing protein [Woeseiaceae bacterium]